MSNAGWMPGPFACIPVECERCIEAVVLKNAAGPRSDERRYGKNTDVVSKALAGGCARGVGGGEFDDAGDGASSSMSISSGSMPAGADPKPPTGTVMLPPGTVTGKGYSDGTTRTWLSSKCSTRAWRSPRLMPQHMKSRQNSFSRVVGVRYSPSEPAVLGCEALNAFMSRDDSDSTEPVIEDDNLKSELLKRGG